MKRALALMLALAAMLFAFCASAQEYEGEWAQVDGAFQVKIPVGWMEYELDQSMIENNVVYLAATEDGESFIQVLGVATEAPIAVDLLQESVAEDYVDAEVCVVGGFNAISYTDEEENMMGLWIQSAANPCVYYLLQLYPLELAADIAASISPIQ